MQAIRFGYDFIQFFFPSQLTFVETEDDQIFLKKPLSNLNVHFGESDAILRIGNLRTFFNRLLFFCDKAEWNGANTSIECIRNVPTVWQMRQTQKRHFGIRSGHRRKRRESIERTNIQMRRIAGK